MTKNKSILIIGPFPEPITGVSLANKTVLSILEKDVDFNVSFINTSYYRFDERLGEFSFRKFSFYIFLNFHFVKIFKSNIIYFTPGQTFFGIVKYGFFILISSLLSKEMIIHVHGNHLRNEYDSLKGTKKKIFHYLISKYTKGIILSKSLKKNLTPFIKEKNIFILPNFAEDYLVKDPNQKDYNNLRIVFLSSLMKEKGILVLLESLKLLEEKGIPYEAKIAGNIDSNSKKEISLLIDELKHAKYLGIVKGKSKKNLLDWSNIFVLPTFYKMEGQPISIIEAMATGNVIITTKHAGIPDIITDKQHGFFIKKNNVESLVEKLICLNDTAEVIEKIGNFNKESFLKNFTIQQFKNKFIKILKT